MGVVPAATLSDLDQLLRDLAGPDATWREGQREAIEDLVIGHKRVLCVQRTGWGKSAVYFIATALLRRAGAGPTVLVSPLLALMRNQIDAATRLGLRAETVNSTNREDWAAVRDLLERDEVDLLLISPERLAWLAHWLPELPGSGIVYALTKRDTEAVAAWLDKRGISAVAYSGETPDADRREIERRLLANDVKAVVATQALGMGYDKPDLGFVVHFQAPGSVIAYYQQVGRAGRALAAADVVLLRGAEDRDIQDWFIESAFPPREHAVAVVEHLEAAEGPVRIPELLALANVGRAKVDALLKILDVEGAVRREGTGWVRADQPWSYDAERYERITAQRRDEQTEMAAFGSSGRCLMLELQGALDDPHAEPCGRCAVCTAPRFDEPLDRDLVVAAQEHLRKRPLTLEPRKQWPATLEG